MATAKFVKFGTRTLHQIPQIVEAATTMPDDLRRVRTRAADRFRDIPHALVSMVRDMRTLGLENGVVIDRSGRTAGLGSLVLDQTFEHAELGGRRSGTQLDLWGVGMDAEEHAEVVGSMIAQTPEARLGAWYSGRYCKPKHRMPPASL